MKQPSLESLKDHALPELAGALRSAEGRIMARWREEVVRLLPESDELTRKQLENSLPEVLRQTARALEAAEPGPTQRLIEASPAHGETRFHQKFNLDELLIEYSILRRIIIEELVQALGGGLSPIQCVAINEALDVALRQAAVAYADHQAGQLQAEANAMAKYLSFLSHDLRGGLNGAMLMIEVLRRDLSGDPKYAASVDDLDGMRRSMLDTVSTMERFLSAERLRRGRMPVKVETVNVGGLFQEMAKNFVPLSEEGQRVEIDPDAAPELKSDRELLSMILQNLLSNAIKYGHRQPVRITASCPPAATPDVACRISVIDQGPGIAPEQMTRLFAPFTRGETYGQKGIGLGLFIARQAAELLGARLWAESTPGSGTSFHLDLPHTPPRTDPA